MAGIAIRSPTARPGGWRDQAPAACPRRYTGQVKPSRAYAAQVHFWTKRAPPRWPAAWRVVFL